MRFGSLFSGIGGLDLGLERAGMTCAWQVEADPYCQKVLTKHWPDVPRHGDIREVDPNALEPVDLICGGFPCQPHSLAGKRLASGDERDLWSEFARIIRGVGPRWVLAENVPGLLSSERGSFFGRVLRDLAELGFDAEWESLPATAFGAYHERWRVFLVAYRQSEHGDSRDLLGPRHYWGPLLQSRRFLGLAVATRGIENPSERLECEPGLARLVHGVPHRTQRLRGAGNAVDPRVAQWIGERIVATTP